MFDKSKDWQFQTVYATIWYLQKTSEGQAAYTTYSAAAFQAAASQVTHVVRESSDRSSPEFLQQQTRNIHLWREKWLEVFSSDRLPCLGDRVLFDGMFWLVSDVYFTDMDDSGVNQRYRLSLQSAKRKPDA